jgi:hypothetical protein
MSTARFTGPLQTRENRLIGIIWRQKQQQQLQQHSLTVRRP